MIYVICGYARSGKTTSIEYFKKMGFVTASSSECLHELSKSMMSVLKITTDLTDKTGTTEINGVPMNNRNILIGIAEDVLVKHFGRSIFANYIDKIAEDNENVVIESFNQEEYQLCNFWKDNEVTILHITRDSELAGVDKRDIIKRAIKIDNNGTIEELYKKLSQV